jgi:hypothetical protein
MPARRGPGAAPKRRTGAHAAPRNRPRLRLPQLGLPGLGRVAALVVAMALAAGLAYLASAPWLQVAQVAWSGTRYVAESNVAAVLDPVKGTNLLRLDGDALARQLESVPGIASARVNSGFPASLTVDIGEEQPAVLWETPRLRLIVGGDGRVFGAMSLSSSIPDALASLPIVQDLRVSSTDIAQGRTIPADERATALQLTGIDPRRMGSTARGLWVRIRDDCGYVVSPRSGPRWSVAFGFYSSDTQQAISGQIEAQVSAVRTLFSAHPERAIGWVDVRNPGKVYWRPNGPGGDTC